MASDNNHANSNLSAFRLLIGIHFFSINIVVLGLSIVIVNGVVVASCVKS